MLLRGLLKEMLRGLRGLLREMLRRALRVLLRVLRGMLRGLWRLVGKKQSFAVCFVVRGASMSNHTPGPSQVLEPCPFCGGDAELQQDLERSGYDEYERQERYYVVRCKKCDASSKRFHQKHLIDFTKYTVKDFRENPILRAKVEDDYDAYCKQSNRLAIDAWNCRATKTEGLA